MFQYMQEPGQLSDVTLHVRLFYIVVRIPVNQTLIFVFHYYLNFFIHLYTVEECVAQVSF